MGTGTAEACSEHTADFAVPSAPGGPAVARGTSSACDEKQENGFLNFLKRKTVSRSLWVLALNAELRVFEVLTGLSEGVLEERAWAGSALLEAGCVAPVQG